MPDEPTHSEPSPQVVFFDDGSIDDALRDRLGEAWAQLSTLAAAGVPIAAGFTVVGTGPADFAEAVAKLEASTGKRFGRGDWPLVLTAWREDETAAPVVPFIGLNDETEESLVAASGDEEFGPNAYQQFIRDFSRLVAGVPAEQFDLTLKQLKWTRGLVNDSELAHEDWEEVVCRYKEIYESHAGGPFPQEPVAQLRAVVDGLQKVGPAGPVNVQEMVFGNMGPDSGAGKESDASSDGWSEPIRRRLADAIAAFRRRVGDQADVEFVVERGRVVIV